jgi:hypothetical protein
LLWRADRLRLVLGFEFLLVVGIQLRLGRSYGAVRQCPWNKRRSCTKQQGFFFRGLYIFSRWSGGGCLRATGATAKGQVQETLHDGSGGSSVSSLLTQTVNQRLLGFVYTLGNEVLRKS